MANLPATLKTATQGAASLTGAFSKASGGSKDLTSRIGSLNAALRSTESTAKSFFALFTAKAVFGEAGEALAKYNKTLFDLSKTSKFTGDSYVAMKKGIDDVNKSTNLSLSESAKFFRVMQRGQYVVRLTAQETSNLAKTLSHEYGPSLQDMSEGLEKLLSLQNKEVNVLRNISRGMGTNELRAYTAGLIMYHKASEQEIEALLRVTRAMYDKDKAETAAERRTKQMSVAMKDLTKAGEDLLLTVAEPMSGAMMSIAKAITSVTNAVKGLVGDSGFKKILEMAPYVMTAGAAVAPLAGIKIAKAAFGKFGAAGAGAASAGKGAVAAGTGAVAVAPGTAANAAGKVGMMGRAVGKIGSPITMIGGLAAEYGGAKLQEAGHTRAGAALSAGGRIAGFTATGAAIGGPFGAAAGAILGVATSLGDLKTAIFGTTEATEKAAEANNWAAAEAKKLGIGADDLKTRYDDMFREQMGGRELGELSQGEQRSFMKAQKSRMELSERSGVAPDKTKALLAVGIQENVAKSVAKAQASAHGLSGEMAESFVKKSIQEFHQNGGGPAFASDFIKAMKDEPVVVKAEIEARKDLGITAATGPDFKKTLAAETVEREAQNLLRVNKLSEDILGYTNQRIDANLQLADITYRYTGDMAKAQEYQDEASKALEAQRTSLTRLVGLMKDMVSGSALSKSTMKEIEESLKKQGMTEGQISDIMKNKELMLAITVDGERKIAELKDKQQKIDSSGADRLAKSTALHAQDLSIMKADLELSKSLYLGLGPTLDQQMQISDTMLDQINYKQKEIDLQEEIIAKGGDEYAAQSKIKQLILEQKQIEKERLDITQNLREAYLQQMTAFTNVQGAFSKIILTQEQGAGEILRQFGGPGSSKMGALGAGSNAPVARLRAGGGIDYMGPEQQKEAFDRYNRDMPEMSRTRVSEAGAAKETGEENRLRGEDLERQTGESPWRGRFFKEGGIVPGSGSGDIVPAMLEPGELVVPKNMAKGIRGFKNGGVAGAPGYRVVGTGGDQIITAQLDQLIKLSMRTVDVLEKGVVQSKKSDEEQARRDKVADQSKDRKRLEPDEKDAGKTKKEKEEEDRAKSKALQKAEEDKLIARQEEWMDYFNKQSSDVIMEPVNTSGLGIGNKAGHKVTGVDQQVKADRRDAGRMAEEAGYGESLTAPEKKPRPLTISERRQAALEKELKEAETEKSSVYEDFSAQTTIKGERELDVHRAKTSRSEAKGKLQELQAEKERLNQEGTLTGNEQNKSDRTDVRGFNPFDALIPGRNDLTKRHMTGADVDRLIEKQFEPSEESKQRDFVGPPEYESHAKRALKDINLRMKKKQEMAPPKSDQQEADDLRDKNKQEAEKRLADIQKKLEYHKQIRKQTARGMKQTHEGTEVSSKFYRPMTEDYTERVEAAKSKHNEAMQQWEKKYGLPKNASAEQRHSWMRKKDAGEIPAKPVMEKVEGIAPGKWGDSNRNATERSQIQINDASEWLGKRAAEDTGIGKSLDNMFKTQKTSDTEELLKKREMGIYNANEKKIEALEKEAAAINDRVLSADQNAKAISEVHKKNNELNQQEKKVVEEQIKSAKAGVEQADAAVAAAEAAYSQQEKVAKDSLNKWVGAGEKVEKSAGDIAGEKGKRGIYHDTDGQVTKWKKSEKGIHYDGKNVGNQPPKGPGIYVDGEKKEVKAKEGLVAGEGLGQASIPKKTEDDFKMKMENGKWVKELLDTNKAQEKTAKEHAETGKKQANSQEETAKATSKAKEAAERQQDKKSVTASSIGGRDEMDKAVVSAIQGSIFGAGMARGGIVPGSGSGDRVPAMLEPGEFVVPKSIVNGIRGYKDGGVVSPSPTLALASSGTGASPQIALNVRGDSVNGIMKSVQGQLAGVLNKMMSPSGTSGRFFDLTQSG